MSPSIGSQEYMSRMSSGGVISSLESGSGASFIQDRYIQDKCPRSLTAMGVIRMT